MGTTSVLSKLDIMMHYSYFVAAITLIASLFRADAIPNTKLGTMSSIKTKDCPKFSGITLDFMVVRDAESINKNTYIFDGTLFLTMAPMLVKFLLVAKDLLSY